MVKDSKISLLNKKLKNERTQLHNGHHGFRSGRSCTDAVFIIRHLIKKRHWNITSIHTCMSNTPSETFDRTYLHKLCDTLAI